MPRKIPFDGELCAGGEPLGPARGTLRGRVVRAREGAVFRQARGAFDAELGEVGDLLDAYGQHLRLSIDLPGGRRLEIRVVRVLPPVLPLSGPAAFSAEFEAIGPPSPEWEPELILAAGAAP